MITVGLTGGIGSGKTTVAKMFEAYGVPVYYSDTRARSIMEEDAELQNEIKDLLGEAAYDGQRLNAPYIAKMVFSNKVLLKSLNALVHPRVREDFLNWTEQQSGEYVIQEAAILFENGGHQLLDKMILVTAPEEIRVQRVMSRDSVAREKVLDRMANQWPDKQKIELADYLIENTDLQKTRQQVDEIHRKLLCLGG